MFHRPKVRKSRKRRRNLSFEQKHSIDTNEHAFFQKKILYLFPKDNKNKPINVPKVPRF